MSSPLRSAFVLLVVLLFAGCDLLRADEKDEEGPEYTSKAQASFGFRAIFGHNPEVIDSLDIFAAQFYRDGEYGTLLNGERATLRVNGVPVESDGYVFDYIPGKEYAFVASVGYETLEGRVEAPAVSEIRYVDFPDTVCSNQPITIKWGYPDGAHNDGLLLVNLEEHSSGHLEPGTTSYTYQPAYGLWNGPKRVQVLTIRSVLFPHLDFPEQELVEWGMGYRGAFFSLFLASEEREMEVLFYETHAECQNES